MNSVILFGQEGWCFWLCFLCFRICNNLNWMSWFGKGYSEGQKVLDREG